MDAAATATFLRSQTPEALLRALIVTRKPGDDRPPDFATNIRDGVVIPSAPLYEVVARGAYHRVPLLFGTNRDEMTSFMMGNPELVETSEMGIPTLKDERLYALLVEYRSEAWRASTVNVVGPIVHGLGHEFFAYRFDWDEQPSLLRRDLGKLIGAAHGLETPFVFGTFDRRGRARFAFTEENEPGRERLSAAMRSYWAEFARRGTPGRGSDGKLPLWKPWGDGAKFLVLDTEEGGGLRMDEHATTVNRLLYRLARDRRLPELQDKCRVLFWLSHRGRAVTKDRYFNTPGLDCSSFPPERYPWAPPAG
jgi:para-nitrobenzyl esterase